MFLDSEKLSTTDETRLSELSSEEKQNELATPKNNHDHRLNLQIDLLRCIAL